MKIKTPCRMCGYEYDQDALGWFGCPNCEGHGLGHDAGVPRDEAAVEKYLTDRTKALKGEVRKVKWLGRDKAPDRVLMINGHTVWVEVKSPTKGPLFPSNPHERAQQREHARMRKTGQRVLVVYSYWMVDELLESLR